MIYSISNKQYIRFKWLIIQDFIHIIGQLSFDRDTQHNRETGSKPVRSRRCIWGVRFVKDNLDNVTGTYSVINTDEGWEDTK